MDLFTASRRFTQPFPAEDRPLPIGNHAIIGDGFSCALIGVDGSVAWQCLPHFDSPSVFASILDPKLGGNFRISPADRAFESLQSYDDDTNVLQTLFRNEDKYNVVMTDFMPWTEDAHASLHEHHRMIEARSGSTRMEIVFDPRFDYGHHQLGRKTPVASCRLPSLRAIAQDATLLAQLVRPASLRWTLATRRSSLRADPETLAVRAHRSDGRRTHHQSAGLARRRAQLGLSLLLDPG